MLSLPNPSSSVPEGTKEFKEISYSVEIGKVGKEKKFPFFKVSN
jgi:hypothetical protein